MNCLYYRYLYTQIDSLTQISHNALVLLIVWSAKQPYQKIKEPVVYGHYFLQQQFFSFKLKRGVYIMNCLRLGVKKGMTTCIFRHKSLLHSLSNVQDGGNKLSYRIYFA